jgi:hypothetical protein
MNIDISDPEICHTINYNVYVRHFLQASLSSPSILVLNAVKQIPCNRPIRCYFAIGSKSFGCELEGLRCARERRDVTDEILILIVMHSQHNWFGYASDTA